MPAGVKTGCSLFRSRDGMTPINQVGYDPNLDPNYDPNLDPNHDPNHLRHLRVCYIGAKIWPYHLNRGQRINVLVQQRIGEIAMANDETDHHLIIAPRRMITPSINNQAIPVMLIVSSSPSNNQSSGTVSLGVEAPSRETLFVSRLKFSYFVEPILHAPNCHLDRARLFLKVWGWFDTCPESNVPLLIFRSTARRPLWPKELARSFPRHGC